MWKPMSRTDEEWAEIATESDNRLAELQAKFDKLIVVTNRELARLHAEKDAYREIAWAAIRQEKSREALEEEMMNMFIYGPEGDEQSYERPKEE